MCSRLFYIELRNKLHEIQEEFSKNIFVNTHKERIVSILNNINIFLQLYDNNHNKNYDDDDYDYDDVIIKIRDVKFTLELLHDLRYKNL